MAMLQLTGIGMAVKAGVLFGGPHAASFTAARIPVSRRQLPYGITVKAATVVAPKYTTVRPLGDRERERGLTGLHAAAGLGLTEECALLGGCRTGMAKVTNAYDLPARMLYQIFQPDVQLSGLMQKILYFSCTLVAAPGSQRD